MSRTASLSSLALVLCLVAPTWSAEAPLDPAVAEARTAMRRGEHRAALILLSNHHPAKPGAFIREPLEAATGSLTRPRGSWAT